MGAYEYGSRQKNGKLLCKSQPGPQTPDIQIPYKNRTEAVGRAEFEVPL